MKRNVSIFILIIISFLYMTPFQTNIKIDQKSAAWENKKRINLHELLSIGSDDLNKREYIFGGITDLYIDKKNNIYILDSMNYRASKFTKNGRFLNFIGNGKGQGPGEFQWANNICVDSVDNVYITDSSSRELEVFDASGKYKYQIKLLKAYPAYDIEIWGNLIFIGVDPRAIRENIWKGGIFQIYSVPDGKLVGSIGECWIKEDTMRHIGSNTIFIDEKNNKCIISYSHPYLIEIYSRERRMLIRLGRRASFFDELEDNGLGTLVYHGSSISMTCLGNKYILNFIRQSIQPNKKARPKYNRYVDFFDMDGNFLETISLDAFKCFEGKIPRRLTSDTEGNLWIGFDEPFPHVTKYRVEILEKK